MSSSGGTYSAMPGSVRGPYARGMSEAHIPSDDELKERLSPLQYEVTQHAGTERAFSGEYWDTKDPGTYPASCARRRCSAPR